MACPVSRCRAARPTGPPIARNCGARRHLPPMLERLQTVTPTGFSDSPVAEPPAAARKREVACRLGSPIVKIAFPAGLAECSYPSYLSSPLAVPTAQARGLPPRPQAACIWSDHSGMTRSSLPERGAACGFFSVPMASCEHVPHAKCQYSDPGPHRLKALFPRLACPSPTCPSWAHARV